MLVLTDRVKESSLSEGNLSYIELNDTFGSFQSFAEGIGDGNTTYYTIENNDDFEVGIGVYEQSTNRLHRNKILDSSNNGDRIVLLGVSVVFCTYPADYSAHLDPSGMLMAQAPHYSGVRFPDSGIQYHAINGSGNRNLITYWSDTRELAASPRFGWNEDTNTLSVSGIANFYSDVSISGNLTVFGTQFITNTEIINTVASGSTFVDTTFIRNSAGSFFHAYVDNDFDDIIALYSTNRQSLFPCTEWRLGLKDFSPTFEAAPTKGYIFGDCNSIGGAANSTNRFTFNASNGFWIRHSDSLIFNVQTGIPDRDDSENNASDPNTGYAVRISNASSSVVPLSVQGAAAQSAHLTEWKDFIGNVLAYITSAGKAFFQSLLFPDGTEQTTAYTQNYRIINNTQTLIPTDDIILINASSTFSVFMPSAVGIGGKKIYIKRTFYFDENTPEIVDSSNSVITVSPNQNTSETIDGLGYRKLSFHNESITLVSDNENWHIV